jgi:hypothetical protein
MQYSIQYIKRNELNTAKWNDCIKTAENGLIYGYTWWLDAMADNWDALVLNDYEAVMPLTWRKKYSFYYLYQPPFTASLGMFYKKENTIGVAAFLKAVPPQFRLWDISLNEMNRLHPADYEGIEVSNRKNMLVNNPQAHSETATSYARLAKRKLKLATEHNITVDTNVNLKSIIAFYIKEYGSQHPAIKQKDYDNLVKACTQAQERGHVNCYTARLDGKVLAVYIVLKDKQYFYSLTGGSTKEGKALGAFYTLTDAAIQDAVLEQCSFRFEGSDISGIEFFNSQFGAEIKHYIHLRLNKLPFPIKLLKR